MQHQCQPPPNYLFNNTTAPATTDDGEFSPVVLGGSTLRSCWGQILEGVLSCCNGKRHFMVLLRTDTIGVLSCGSETQQRKVLLRTDRGEAFSAVGKEATV